MEVSATLPKRTIRGEALVIAVLSSIAVAALLVAFALVSRFRSWQSTLAERTYRHGLNAMAYGSPAEAVEYFRSALFFQPENFEYQLSLAQALESAGRFDEAEAYLQSLWERQPQSGVVNLQLGRLAAHRHLTSDVLRYYHNAVYGIWTSQPDQDRRLARIELVDFLINNHDVTQAQAELIAMGAGLPGDAQLHVQLANLFMRLPDYEHALEQFKEARQLDRHNVQAAAGAGTAAFHLGWFRTALHFLDIAIKSGDHDPDMQSMMKTASLVVSSNPKVRGLSFTARLSRVQQDFQVARGRLQDCLQSHGETLAQTPVTGEPATGSLQQLDTRMSQLAAKMNRRSEFNDPDFRDDVMQAVFDVEEETEDACGTPTGADLALLLLGRSQEAAEQ